MRTYILALCDLRTKKLTRFRCQAKTFNEAVTLAQKAINGFPNLPGDRAAEVLHGTVNA